MSIIQEDCYWYVSDGFMKAKCSDCHEEDNKNEWYWSGASNGYGDYDLNCSICNKPLNLREKNENTPPI